MKTYAVLENNVVVNIIVASSLEIAEEVTNSNCVFITDATGNAHIGLSYANGVFEQPTPLESELEPEA
jgi:hypothetical protein